MPDRRDPTLRHLALAVAAVTALALVGTAAFALAGERPLDAFYRTANTITTAGMDSRPAGTGGKLVTVASDGFRLVGYGLARGVTVSGTVKLAERGGVTLKFQGPLTVGGSSASKGTLQLQASGLRGTLGGKAVP